MVFSINRSIKSKKILKIFFYLYIFFSVLLFRMYPLMICVFSLVLVLNVPISFASYDFFMLSETWPATYCGIKNRLLPCAKQPNTFTIHGLWPQNHIGPQPASCSNLQKDKFDKRIITSSLKSALETGWPNLNTQNDMRFWVTEWDKHGTCSLNKFSQFNYFRLALKIKGEYNLMTILSGEQIVLHHSTAYDKNSIIQAIHGVIGTYPQLTCYKYNLNKQSYYNLSEIRLCLDDNGKNYINCPTPTTNCNGNMLYWPI
ncbi:Intracellular ribonuclease LX [Glycine soja]|nr:Intracellular ribonuclease LX [Glycine soja]